MRRPASTGFLPAAALATALAAAMPAHADVDSAVHTVKRDSVQMAHDARIQAGRAAAGFKRGAREFGHAVKRDTRQTRATVAARARQAGHSIRNGTHEVGRSIRQGAVRLRQSAKSRESAD